jgi:hypothetical protein
LKCARREEQVDLASAHVDPPREVDVTLAGAKVYADDGDNQSG